jgi:uncharacterized protein (DUF1697 family)
MCEAVGFTNVRTYIASGNVVFDSKLAEASVKSRLERCLEEYAGKPVGVAVRTSEELAQVLTANPFKSAAPNRTVAIFLDSAPPADALTHASGQREEEMALGTREIYVHYNNGMADTKLKIPAARTGTARNMNTVGKLVDMANE